MEYGKEIAEIGRLIASMALLDEIRHSVADITTDGVVTDGAHSGAGKEYDVVVKCGSVSANLVSRRISGKVADVKIKKIAEDMLGVNMSRRIGGKK